MKAAVLRAAGQPVTIEEVRLRDPGPGEVRVAIRAAGLCHSDLSVIDGAIPYPTPVVLGHEGAGVVDAVGAGVTAVKEGDTVVLSTLAHCGRCPACEVGRPTECRNAPSPKDARPFTLHGEPAYQFANASAFANCTVVREQSAIAIDARVPFDRAALIGCGIMTGVGAVLNREQAVRGVVWFIATTPLWIVGAVANPEARLPWWSLAAGLELIGTWLAHPVFGRWLRSENAAFDFEHMMERCRLFLIIAAGTLPQRIQRLLMGCPVRWPFELGHGVP